MQIFTKQKISLPTSTKLTSVLRPLFFILLLVAFIAADAQNPPNWTSKQLMEPADLAAELKANNGKPVVICVGPGAIIPTSLNAGPSNSQKGLENLTSLLNNLPKESKLVLYCGCCPFDPCPNVRPAINLLNQMKFSNYYLLNLPRNIKADWIDKGFPTIK